MATKKKTGLRKARPRARALTKAQIAARVASRFKPRYAVECTYDGFDAALDRRLMKLAGKRRIHGSGVWLTAGLRDVEFNYASLALAKAAARRIKAARVCGHDGRPVRVMLRCYWRA